MGRKVPGNERSREGTFVPRERKVPGTKVPWNFPGNKSSLPGTKVPWRLELSFLHRDLSFLGTKGLGYERSVIPALRTVCY